MTNKKLHTCFRLVPKSMTLDDLEGHYAFCFKIHAFSEPSKKNVSEGRPVLSVAKMWSSDSSFWQYKVYVA